jgi:hypothetical protein
MKYQTLLFILSSNETKKVNKQNSSINIFKKKRRDITFF